MSFRHTCLCLALTWSLAAHAGDTAPRIVSLSPHITELLFAAGAGSYLVGVDGASDYPPAVAGIARVGEPSALDIEALVKLKPSLIVLWDSGTPARNKAELERLHLHLLVTDQQRLDDIGAALADFGRLAGTEAVALPAAARYRAELARLRGEYAARTRLKVFYQVWDRPMYTLSGAQVVSEVMSLCGGDNVFGELGTLAPAVDREAVLARNPDVILIAATGAEGARQARDWAQFSDLAAVRRRAVFTIDPSLTGRMAPRILKGVREVCQLLDQARLKRPDTGTSDPGKP